MENFHWLHAKTVHFPIALLFVYALVEILGSVTKKDFFSNAAFLILILGIIASIAALITGDQAFQYFDKTYLNASIELKDLIHQHQNAASIAVWYFVFLTVARTIFFIQVFLKSNYQNFKNKGRYLFSLLAIIGCIFLFTAANLGGELVFKFGVGTELFQLEQIK